MRPPLYNEAAEQAVLSAVMLAPAAMVTAREMLQVESFYRPSHGTLFAACAALQDAGTIIDPLTLSDALDRSGTLAAAGGREYVGYLVDVVPTAANVLHHVRIVRDLADRRAAVAVAELLIEGAHDRAMSLQTVAQSATSALLPTAAALTRRGYRPIADIALDVADDLEAAANGTLMGIPWGYRDLDAATGGMLAGELAILCGVPGGCKTAFALNIGLRDARRGDGVGVVSAEMKDRALVSRLMANLAQVNTVAIRKGTLRDDEYVRLGQALGETRLLPMWIDDTPTPDIALIVARGRALKAKHPHIRRMIFDFIQLFESKGGSDDNRSRELSTISYALKGLCKELDVAGIVTCQVDAANIEKRVDKRPQISDLRWSQAMREAGDFVAMMYRPAMYDEFAHDSIELSFAKARELPPFNVTVDWVGKFLRVDDQPRFPQVRQPTLGLAG